MAAPPWTVDGRLSTDTLVVKPRLEPTNKVTRNLPWSGPRPLFIPVCVNPGFALQASVPLEPRIFFSVDTMAFLTCFASAVSLYHLGP